MKPPFGCLSVAAAAYPDLSSLCHLLILLPHPSTDICAFVLTSVYFSSHKPLRLSAFRNAARLLARWHIERWGGKAAQGSGGQELGSSNLSWKKRHLTSSIDFFFLALGARS